MYLTAPEITTYCPVGVSTAEVAIASELIDSYLGKSLVSVQRTEEVSLNKHNRAKLSYHPIISIDEVATYVIVSGTRTKKVLTTSGVVLDTDGDGYFTYYPPNADLTYLQIYQAYPQLYKIINTLEIKYTAGYAAYPERLKRACAMIATNIFDQSSFLGLKQKSTVDYQIMLNSDSFLTSDIKMMLVGL